MTYERRCSHCDVKTPVEFLVDVSDLDPFLNLVCTDCESELVADLHDDVSCDCKACNRARARADRIHREAQAQMQGGLSPIAHELLGPGWLDEGKPMSKSSSPAKLTVVVPPTEHTLEDRRVFAVLEYLEAELLTLRHGPLTRERAAVTLMAIQGHVERAAGIYADVEEAEGREILPPHLAVVPVAP